MLWAVAKRCLAFVSVVLAVSVATFASTALLGGCVECQVSGIEALDDETRAEIREDLRLDDPLHERYTTWLGDAVTGDLGQSYRTRQEVVDAITERLPVTLELVVLSIALSLALSIPLGTLSAYRAGGVLDRVVSATGFGLLAIPSFLMAILLIELFAVEWGWLPASGWTPLTQDPVDNLRSALLPSLALATSSLAVLTRMLRSDMVTTLDQDFVNVARSKGLPTWHVLIRHGLRPSSMSLMTVTALAVGNLLGGAVLVEQVFGLPGLGRLLVVSVSSRDLLMVQGIVLVVTVGFVLVNAVVDVLYTVVDPRLRRTQQHARVADG
jgi:peptide/nickel transport system permease protein